MPSAGAVAAVQPMWGFPRGKPQFFADSLATLGLGVCSYGFGKRIPRALQAGVGVQLLVPRVRNHFLVREDDFEPICGWSLWNRLRSEVERDVDGPVAHWLHIRSQWGKSRSSALGMDKLGQPQVFVTVEREDARTLYPDRVQGRSFRVPRVRKRVPLDFWVASARDPLPRFHRTPRWNPSLLRRLADEASSLLCGLLEQPAALPQGWRPIHGDFVPWNLREDATGQLWLLDWEDAGWGPPAADILRYAVAFHSIHHRSAEEIANTLPGSLGCSAAELATAAQFWLGHRNLKRPVNMSNPDRWQRQDVARAVIETETLERIAAAAAE